MCSAKIDGRVVALIGSRSFALKKKKRKTWMRGHLLVLCVSFPQVLPLKLQTSKNIALSNPNQRNVKTLEVASTFRLRSFLVGFVLAELGYVFEKGARAAMTVFRIECTHSSRVKSFGQREATATN